MFEHRSNAYKQTHPHRRILVCIYTPPTHQVGETRAENLTLNRTQSLTPRCSMLHGPFCIYNFRLGRTIHLFVYPCSFVFIRMWLSLSISFIRDSNQPVKVIAGGNGAVSMPIKFYPRSQNMVANNDSLIAVVTFWLRLATVLRIRGNKYMYKTHIYIEFPSRRQSYIYICVVIVQGLLEIYVCAPQNIDRRNYYDAEWYSLVSVVLGMAEWVRLQLRWYMRTNAWIKTVARAAIRHSRFKVIYHGGLTK